MCRETYLRLCMVGLLAAALLKPVTLLAQTPASAQPTQVADTVLLPSPTGPHLVGKTVWDWPDPKRMDDLSPEADDVRELMITAWYPAQKTALPPVSRKNLPLYSPLSRAFEDVRDEAIPGARFERMTAPAPVIILCPGRGTAANSYSAIAEDLASYGYAVFGFDAPHTGFVRYPDQRTIEPSDAFVIPRNILMGPYEKVDAIYAPAEKLGHDDVDFVLRKIAQLNANDSTRRFTGRLDLTRIGALSHSMGSRSCGAAVSGNNRFRALVTADGVPPRAARLRGFNQALLMLISGDMPDAAIPNFRSVIPNRRNDVFIVRVPQSVHNSITDRLYLRPTDLKFDPASRLAIYRQLVRSFLDRYVRRANAPVAVEDRYAAEVKIEENRKP